MLFLNDDQDLVGASKFCIQSQFLLLCTATGDEILLIDFDVTIKENDLCVIFCIILRCLLFDVVGPQSPSIPLTIDDIDESSRPLKTELDVGITSFWKYRQIPKGPQGQIFDRQVHLQTDPTQPLKFKDPAFVESSAASNLSHFGKARIGEGNDTTPNPQKLVKIGLEVRDISKKMKALSNKAQEREKAKLSSK